LLRFDQVHWREQRIDLVISKTQRRLELPLVDDVDGALVSYIRHGRPACDAREIFVRHVAPISPLAGRNSLWSVMHRAVESAGIRISSGERGLRILRHTAATRLLQRGVPFDTISDILGHASVDTTRRYAQVDFAALRMVALSQADVDR
jgi:integrase